MPACSFCRKNFSPLGKQAWVLLVYCESPSDSIQVGPGHHGGLFRGSAVCSVAFQASTVQQSVNLKPGIPFAELSYVCVFKSPYFSDVVGVRVIIGTGLLVTLPSVTTLRCPIWYDGRPVLYTVLTEKDFTVALKIFICLIFFPFVSTF